jgi:NAD-dependent SIR2 family protein deacetylase
MHASLEPCRRANPAAYEPARSEVLEPSIPTRISEGPSVPNSNRTDCDPSDVSVITAVSQQPRDPHHGTVNVEPSDQPFHAVVDLIADGDVAVLTGAGLSTESGIPDYRGPMGRARSFAPITYQAFVGSTSDRRRYWARSHLGWQRIAHALPNSGHAAVADLERRGLLSGIITQNVDGLHQAAGAQQVVDLHGRLDRVVCLDCGAVSTRAALDNRLREANAGWVARADQLNPDGDVDVALHDVERFRIVGCEHCDGLLKPDVVFFGESVPRPRVEQCYELVDNAGAVLVLGSSLSVMSGYRFVRHAAKIGVPVAIVNQGPTRGDVHAEVTLDAALGATLTALVKQLDRIAAMT